MLLTIYYYVADTYHGPKVKEVMRPGSYLTSLKSFFKNISAF